MATKTSQKAALQAFIREQKPKVNTKLCSCMTCAHSMLHRYGSNPILAACLQKPQPGNAKFPYEVMVASTVLVCPTWAQAVGEKWVQPRLSTRTA